MDKLVETKRVFLKTYGCQMNVYDTDRMWSKLRAVGYERSENPVNADVILLNTCAIRDKAEQKVRSLLGKFKALKGQNPELVLGVTGCVGQRMGRTLLEKLPHLDLVMGPDQVDEVVDVLQEAAKGRRAVRVGLEHRGRSYTQPAQELSGKPSEFLTIIRGCDHFCSYCIVPFTRGREQSRPMEEVLKDVNQAAEAGTKEVVFLGQNINTYGKGTPDSLAQLIEATNLVEGIERIRYITSHPYDLGEDLIAQFGSVPKLCPQLHLPFQSGNARVLKKMHRLYTPQEYREIIAKLRKACPHIALSTDVIVGFPGETEAEFEDTLELFKDIEFDSAFMFKYSERPGTRAAKEYPDSLSEEEKNKRLQRLLDLANPMFERRNQAQLGKEVEVLVDRMDKRGELLSGRTEDFRLIHLKNAGPAFYGKIVRAKVVEAHRTHLIGECADGQ